MLLPRELLIRFLTTLLIILVFRYILNTLRNDIVNYEGIQRIRTIRIGSRKTRRLRLVFLLSYFLREGVIMATQGIEFFKILVFD